MTALALVMHQLGVMLAYRPLLDPLPIDRHWPWLLLPIAALIALAYKAIKLEDLAELPRQATIMTVQIIVGMMLAAAALWALVAMV